MGSRGQRSAAASTGTRNPTITAKAISIQNTPVITQPTIQQAQTANNSAFSATDTQGYHQLYNGRGYFQKQNMSIDQQMATVNYLSNTPVAGSAYSTSQWLNYRMTHGLPLSENEKFMYTYLMGAMHNLGYNVNLTRYDHESFVNNMLDQAFGTTGRNYENLSVQQLQSLLVGKTYSENRFVSTSYNDFKNVNTFTDRAVRIEYKAPASTQAFMPGTGPGGDFGEIVLQPNQNYKITGVRFDNNVTAYKKGKMGYAKRIVLTVEIG